MKKTCKSVLALALTLCAGLLSLNSNAQGRVFAWGDNSFGQLGNGSLIGSNVPAPVYNLDHVTAAAGGALHSIALKSDGTVWAWGYNNEGELGNGTNDYSTLPVQVSGLTNVIAVACGEEHSIALKADGTVWTWGANFFGQLGNGQNADRNVPVQVYGLNGVTAIAGGTAHTLAVKSDGTVWAWGNNTYGQLGNGTTASSNIPVQVRGLNFDGPPLANMVSVAAGGYFSLALGGANTGNAVVGWGDNTFSQLGTAGWANPQTWPVEVGLISPRQGGALTRMTHIAAGLYYGLAVRVDGAMFAWGHNPYGELGNGTTSDSQFPTAMDFTAAANAAAGYDHNIAISYSGYIDTCGNNFYGQIGNGTYQNSLDQIVLTSLPAMATVAAGGNHTLAVERIGTLPTKLTLAPAVGQIGKSATVVAKVKTSGSPIYGLTVQFTLNGGEPFSIVTDQNGQAKFTILVPEYMPIGVYPVTASFSGDANYLSSSASSTLTITKGPVKIQVANVSGHAGSTVTLSATLNNAAIVSLQGVTLTFSVGGKVVGSAVTDYNGVATLPYKIPAGTAKGTYALSVSFAGNSKHLPGVGSGKLVVK